jgi:hypothetical protein
MVCVVQDISDFDRRAAATIQNYTGATKTITLREALPFIPDANDQVYFLLQPPMGRGRLAP